MVDNSDSESYYLLSRAALSLRSIFDSPEVATVQAVVLMASYHGMGGKRFTMDSSVSRNNFPFFFFGLNEHSPVVAVLPRGYLGPKCKVLLLLFPITMSYV